jgi:pyrroline-5-carboxylate reductase
VRGSQYVVLAVKPQVLPVVAAPLANVLTPEQVVLSLLAGKSLETLGRLLKHERIVRVMPNTPAQIGQGMMVWTAAQAVTTDERAWVASLLGALGRERYMEAEKDIDLATAVSGSGPGFVFLIIEALIDAGVYIGMSRQMAEELVTQTVLGSAMLARDKGMHPALLRNMVASPGGTTAAGLQVLEKHALRAVIVEAVVAAYEKAQLLGRADT